MSGGARHFCTNATSIFIAGCKVCSLMTPAPMRAACVPFVLLPDVPQGRAVEQSMLEGFGMTQEDTTAGGTTCSTQSRMWGIRRGAGGTCSAQAQLWLTKKRSFEVCTGFVQRPRRHYNPDEVHGHKGSIHTDGWCRGQGPGDRTGTGAWQEQRQRTLPPATRQRTLAVPTAAQSRSTAGSPA